MKLLKEFLEALHISAPAMFAGLAGGAVSLFRYRDISPKRAGFLLFCSAITSGYITGLVIHKTGLKPEFAGAVGFLIGCVFWVFFDLFISFATYFERNPEKTITLLVSLLPISKLKSNTKNEETDENSSEFGPDPNGDNPGDEPKGPEGI